jgi:hypothetical protein
VAFKKKMAQKLTAKLKSFFFSSISCDLSGELFENEFWNFLATFHSLVEHNSLKAKKPSSNRLKGSVNDFIFGGRGKDKLCGRSDSVSSKKIDELHQYHLYALAARISRRFVVI